jgi:hypothetical protein
MSRAQTSPVHSRGLIRARSRHFCSCKPFIFFSRVQFVHFCNFLTHVISASYGVRFSVTSVVSHVYENMRSRVPRAVSIAGLAGPPLCYSATIEYAAR